MADSKSLRHRFSDPKTFKQYEPDGNISKQLYRISEKIRCEKIGTSYFKGVKNNIETFYQEMVNGLDLKSSEDKIVESFENYLRTKFLEFEYLFEYFCLNKFSFIINSPRNVIF